MGQNTTDNMEQNTQPDSTPGTQPGGAPGTQPDTGPDMRPDSAPGTQPGDASGTQPDTGPDMRPDSAQRAGQAAAVRRRFGINGCTLKMIAVITMLIDHTGAGVLGRYLAMNGIGNLDINNMAGVDAWMNANAALYGTYNIMRLIGRIAFPIYCFLLIEGFEHTRSRKKYALRLFAFALISEIPFDLLFNGQVLETGYQNVFFTLLLGLLTMMAFDWVSQLPKLQNLLRMSGMFAAILAGMLAAHFLQTDYAATGVLCIMLLYIFRRKKWQQIVVGCFAFLWELTAPLAFIPIGFYNGKRGHQMKYFFYAFYPVHLLLLYLVCVALGIAGYPSM